ncbi:MAG: hypothetical protein R3292_13680 [Alcanivorax sp.]|nr:hypothetical protein [Alcanivorax sp.]
MYTRIPPLEEREVEQELHQPAGLGKRRRDLVLFSRHFVACQGQIFNLAFLAPRPQRIRTIAWVSIGFSLAFVVAAGLAFARSQIPLALGAAGVAMVLGVVAFLRCSDRLLFYTRTGGIPAFDLRNRLTDRRQLQSLLEILESRSKAAAKCLPAGSQRLAAEVAEHRRLMLSGWLKPHSYERAKKRIFARYSRMGAPKKKAA